MGYQQVQLSNDNGPEILSSGGLTKGFTMEGIFSRTQSIEMDDVETGGKKQVTAYFFEKDGIETGIWETGKLKSLFSRVSLGSKLKLVYLGKVKATAGKAKGRMVHDYELYFDDTGITTNGTPQAAATPAQVPAIDAGTRNAAPQPKKPNLAKVSG